MHLDLPLQPYKVQLTRQLKPADRLQCRNFSNKIFFSDEPNFTLGGYVNKQNCCIWGSENPQVIEQDPLHQKKSLVGALFGPKA